MTLAPDFRDDLSEHKPRTLAKALADCRLLMAPALYSRLAVYAQTRLPARDLQNVFSLDAYRGKRK